MNPVWQGKLEKVDDYRWKIPRSYKPGMKVPGLIFASKSLIPSIINDKAIEQVANVAFLPGIVKYSLAMPDIHWGYGFSIGGVAATDPERDGVISPGGVGYDISCLSGNSFILNELGYNLPIEEYEKIWKNENINCIDFKRKLPEVTKISHFLKRKPGGKVYKLTTKTGRSIIATEDHPFYSNGGMRPLGSLSKGESVAIYPFEGVPYETPGEKVIIAEDDIKNLLLSLGKDSRGNGLEQIIIHFKKRNLLPLRYDSPQLPHILKVMGYIFGDGSIHFTNKRGKGITWFYGRPEDLKDIRQDILKIGYNPSKIYSRNRNHKIKTHYSEYEFNRTESSFKVCSSSFAALLVALGTPFGNKTAQDYRLPPWIFNMPLWQKRLFLAAFFGAEMSTPKTMVNLNYNFYCPTISMNKKEKFVESGELFLRDISQLLKEFNVSTQKISKRIEVINKDNEVSSRLRLILSGLPEDMVNLYTKVGFEYNRHKKFLANIAIQYLKLKQIIIEEKERVVVAAAQLRKGTGWSASEIYKKCTSSLVNLRFIERSVYDERITSPRMGPRDPDFIQFSKEATDGLENSGMVWDAIVSKEEIAFDEYVYDFTVEYSGHNFIANNFVVSNCGVRLLRSELLLDEVKPKLEKLVNALFSDIPCGVGSSGDIKVSYKEEKEIFIKGAGWAVKKGYGVKEDLECTEDNGVINGADPQDVSDRACERGKKQSGTLGSGNHFLEIQIVDEIYDEKKANIFNLFKGQITVMIHSGSRGFGYQVCDDYVKGMVHTLRKYNISVPDRQLACAPINSPEGKSYMASMRCAANYAWANRQCLMHLTREVFEKIFNRSWTALGLNLVYDVAHNIAKMERHVVDGEERLLCVHRKGATRAFPPYHPDIPERYREAGQPVIIPGDMGTFSYVLAGTEAAMTETFGSTCHGAGRSLSRSAAIKKCQGRQIDKELFDKSGIIVRASGRSTLAEEAPEAYKDVNEVVEVVHRAGISTKVARMRPLGVIKG